jgi:hypothetical protein
MFSLDDYYIPIVVLANVVSRLACIVLPPEGSTKAAGRLVLMSRQVLPSSSRGSGEGECSVKERLKCAVFAEWLQALYGCSVTARD